MPSVHWYHTTKGNWTTSWCGKRATVYRKRSGWGVVIDGDFVEATWTDESVALAWAAEALVKAGEAEEGEKSQLPPAPSSKPRSPRTHRRDWRPSATILPWWAKELGLQQQDLTIDAIKAAYYSLARKLHPDRGGRPEDMTNLNRAYEEAIEYMLKPTTEIAR